jgi:uncharacterized membrane protein YfcA
MGGGIWILTAAALINAMAFFFQRLTGFGSAIIATPLLALFWQPHNAINLLTIYQWVFGTALIWKTWRQLLDHKLLWFLVAFVPATIVGAFTLPVLPEYIVRTAIGVIVLIVLVQWLLVPEFRFRGKAIVPMALVFGMLSGGVQGAFGTGGPFFLAYYGSVEKKGSSIRDGSIAVFFIANFLRLPIAASMAQLTQPVLLAAALGLIPFIAAMYFGARLTDSIDDKLFRRAMIAILALAAFNLILG